MVDNRSNMRTWQNKLYNLQQEAPKPNQINCLVYFKHRPEQYNSAYHGPLSRQATDTILLKCPSGSYLIRDSQRSADAYTLAIKFDDLVKNYKLYYDSEKKLHFVGEKKFESVDLLVADGLIYLYIETRGSDILRKLTELKNYELSPYYKTRYTLYAHPHIEEHLTRVHNQYPLHPNGISVATVSCSAVPINTSKPQHVNVSRRRQSINFDFCRSYSDVKLRSKNDRNQTIKQHFSTDSQVDVDFMKTPAGDTFENITENDEINTTRLSAKRHSSGKFVESDEFPLANIEFDSKKSVEDNTKLNHTSENGINRFDKDQELSPKKSNQTTEHLSYGNNNSIDNCSVDLSEKAAMTCNAIASPITADCRLHLDTSSVTSLLLNENRTTSPLNVPPRRVSQSRDIQRLKKQSQTFGGPILNSSVNHKTLKINEKAHNFQIHTYIGPHWCFFCTHFIWGLVAQGVKCSDCGFQAHKRCSVNVPNDCLPDMKQLKRVFGVDLTRLARAENRSIPMVLVKCINELERRGGLEMEGIFRVPGNHEVVEEFRIALDKDHGSVDLSENHCSDLNTISSLIKCFLRQLPIPLITYEIYPSLIKLARDETMPEDQKQELLKTTIEMLPPAHYHSLNFLMNHLNRVVANHHKNLMTAENLAIVLAPSLMSSSYTDPSSCMVGAKFEQAVIERMIIYCSSLFTKYPPSESNEDATIQTPTYLPNYSSTSNFSIHSKSSYSPEHANVVSLPS